jgi:F0F1-type ATP synthase membrane subunit c/vacuolar-type H+-ATPase subunit K
MRPNDDDSDPPKLKSLAQSARGNQLKQVRGTLLAIGILTILLNGWQLFLVPGMVRAEIAKHGGIAPNAPEMQAAEAVAMIIGFAFPGSLVLLGLVFIVLALLVRSHPVPITITALVLFIIPAVVCGIMNLGSGWIGLTIANIFCIIALAKAVRTAFAYERERRAELAFADVDRDEVGDE